MSKILLARFDEARIEKISRIQKSTGLTVSQLFRKFVDVAEVETLRLNLSANANDDTTGQGKNVVAA